MKPSVLVAVGLLLAACSDSDASAPASAAPDGGESTDTPDGSTSTTPDGATATPTELVPGCAVTQATSATATVSESGCAVLNRDASACAAARTAAGLSGVWLRLSCRVTLTVANGIVTASSDGQPDYASFYFQDGSACYAAYPTGKRNPNRIQTQNIKVAMPLTPGGSGETMHTAVVGIAINGVPIFGNFAAPGDDIFREAETFDRCSGHPQMSGQYHYHAEPTSISQDDANFIGIMRDGYPIYGRRDSDGSMPTLDDDGGHTGVTADSPSTPVYHYHVNEQTSTANGTAGDKQWFLTKGRYHSAPATCTGC